MSENSDVVSVGRVVGLWRYPVKSMGAEALSEAEISWHGLQGDRRWAFIRNDAARSAFPWFTLRQRSDMSQYVPSFADPNKPDTSKTLVKTPSGEIFYVDDQSLGLDLCADGARVIKQDRGVFDTFPLSLITTQTIARRVDERDGRCVVISIDPVTAERNTEVFRTVTDERQRCLGVYGSIVDPGRIAVDDKVRLESPE